MGPSQRPSQDRPAQVWRVSLYRDDSETTVVVDNVKHAFMTAGNTVLTVAYYTGDGGHAYLNYPRERLAWWRVERVGVDDNV